MTDISTCLVLPVSSQAQRQLVIDDIKRLGWKLSNVKFLSGTDRDHVLPIIEDCFGTDYQQRPEVPHWLSCDDWALVHIAHRWLEVSGGEWRIVAITQEHAELMTPIRHMFAPLEEYCRSTGNAAVATSRRSGLYAAQWFPVAGVEPEVVRI